MTKLFLFLALLAAFEALRRIYNRSYGMKVCRRCGKLLGDATAAICPACGQAAVPASQPGQSGPSSPNAEPQGLGCFFRLLILLALGVAFIVWTVLFNPMVPSEMHPGKGSRARNSQNLNAIRNALSEYYGKHDGRYPKRLETLVEERLMDRLPGVETREHGRQMGIAVFGAEVCPAVSIDGKKVRDTGGWGYVSAPAVPCHGVVFVDCTHRIPSGRGSIWADERSNDSWFTW